MDFRRRLGVCLFNFHCAVNLSTCLFSGLGSCGCAVLESQVAPQWLWKGRRVLIFDGAAGSMPDMQENQPNSVPKRLNERFFQHGNSCGGKGASHRSLLGICRALAGETA
jgi:hypothetical protein